MSDDKDEFGRQKLSQLGHPRDLFTPEEQQELDAQLASMNAQKNVKLLPAESELRTVRIAYQRLIEVSGKSLAVLSDLAALSFQHGRGQRCSFCDGAETPVSDKLPASFAMVHEPDCVWLRASQIVGNNDG